MRSILYALALLVTACASSPPPKPVNPAITSAVVNSEPPRAMGETPATQQATFQSAQPTPAPAPQPRRSPP